MGERVWDLELDGAPHAVRFTHGWFTGKRAVWLDGEPLGETAWNLVDAGGHLDFEVGDHVLRVATATGGLTYRHTLLLDGVPVDPDDRARLDARVARLLPKRGRAVGGWRAEVRAHPVAESCFSVFSVALAAAPFYVAGTVGLDEIQGTELIAFTRADDAGLARALGELGAALLRARVGEVGPGKPLPLPFYGRPGCFLTEPPPHWIHAPTLMQAWRCWVAAAVPLSAEELEQVARAGLHDLVEERVASGRFAWVD